tara:strand:- start:2329 stop:3588 length:1260 start_codon:yes stop_codon:yes gene_type:complete
MRHIKSISTNIKTPGGLEVTGLGPNVFISGDNGSGKTALVNAVQLALTGKASDLSGNRKGKSASLLEGLRPEGEEMLYARLELSDDSVAHWEMTPDGKVNHARSPGLKEELCFPIDEAIDALKGSKETTLKFFCKYFLMPDDFTAIEAKFSEDELAIHESLLTQHTPQKGSCLPLLDAYEEVSSFKRKHSGNVTALEKVAEMFSIDTEYVPTPQEEVAFSLRAACQWGVSSGLSKHCLLCEQPAEGVGWFERLNDLSKFNPQPPFSGLLVARLKGHKKHKAACAKVASVYMDRIEKAFMSARVRLENIISEQLGKRFSMRIEGNRISMGYASKTGPMPHLSGAEWVELACALSAAAAIRSTGKYSVIIAPDRALDRKTLRALMSGLKGVPANIFVQSPLQPWGRPLAGWTKIELTEESS